MKVVIDIPEEVYNSIKSNEEIINYITKDGRGSMVLHGSLAIINGTILPEGHGRLIDFDALDKDFDKCTCAENCNFLTCPVYSQKVIIKADKGE